MDDIEITHIFTRDGCKLFLNGQGHLPCSTHTKEFVMQYLDDSAAADTDQNPRA